MMEHKGGMTGWIPLAHCRREGDPAYPSPPIMAPALYWNARANMKHGAETYRIAVYACENISDCTHWMPLPAPPEDSE